MLESEFFPEYNGKSVTELGQEMAKVAEEVDKADDILKKLKARYEHLRVHRIPAALEEAGLKNMKLASGRGITVTDQWHVSCNKENQPQLFAWLSSVGAGDLIIQTVAAQSLKAFVKDRAAHMLDYPSEIIKVTVIPTAKFF